jgi:hypothetical protein
MHRARGVRSAFPPSEGVEVLAMATQKPATYHCPATRWSLDDLVAALPQHRLPPISRSRSLSEKAPGESSRVAVGQMTGDNASSL